MQINCLDKKSENVKKWFSALGKEKTYEQFLVHNYFLPDFEDYIAVNKDAVSIQKAREILKEILPTGFEYKPIEELVEFDNLQAEGAFYKDTLYFAKQANLYTVYEEGFHAIMQRLLPENTRKEILNAVKSLVGNRLKDVLAKYPNNSEEYALEEELAKEYINDKLYKESNLVSSKDRINKLAKRLSVLGSSAYSVAEAIIKFFDYLSSFFNNVQENKQKIEALFNIINSGAFTSSVKLNDIQYEFPSLRLIYLSDGVRTFNQKEQAKVYSGIKSIYKAIRQNKDTLEADLTKAIELYRNEVNLDEEVDLILSPFRKSRVVKNAVNERYQTVFEDLIKQIKDNPILSEEADEEDSDAISDQINGSSDKDNQKSAIARLSKETRDYISSIGDLVKIINYNGKPIYVKSYIDINNVYSSIVRNLANTPDMFMKIKKMIDLTDDRKSVDTKVFVNQFLEDVFLSDLKTKLKGLTAEEYLKERETALEDLKQQIKSKQGFSFGEMKDGVLVNTEDKNSNLIYINPKGASFAQKVLKSFDLYTADVIQQLIDYNNGDLMNYDPHRANVVNPQLDEWRSYYESQPKTQISSFDFKSENTTLERVRERYFDILGINVSDNYIRFALGKIGNPNYKEYAEQFDSIPDQDIASIDDFNTIRNYHNKPNQKEGNIYVETEGKDTTSVITRLKTIARGNAYFDETVLESTYQDAEGKYIYAHRNRTFNLNLANIVGSGRTWSTESLNEIYDTELKKIVQKFHEKNPIFKSIQKGIKFNKLERFSYGGFRTENKDEQGNKKEGYERNTSFKEITPEEFEVAKINLWLKIKRQKDEDGRSIITTPQFVGHFETANTAEFQYMEYLAPIGNDGELTFSAKNQWLEYIETEYQRINNFIERLVDSGLIDITQEVSEQKLKLTTELLLSNGFKSAINGYNTGELIYSVKEGVVSISPDTKLRVLQYSTELNAFKNLNGIYNAFYYTKNEQKLPYLYENKETILKEIGEIYGKNLTDTVNKIKELNLTGLSKFITGSYDSKKLTNYERDVIQALNLGANRDFNLKQFYANYELNSIGYNRFIFGDMNIYNKNDMSDLFKRMKGSNASGLSAYSEFMNLDLGIDKVFTEFKTLIHEEPKGTSSTDGNLIDSMDAQAYASLQHTRNLLWGLGRLDSNTANIITKLHNGEQLSKEDEKWMFQNDTFLSANKTTAFTTSQLIKTSEGYSAALSKRSTSIPVEINITEEEYKNLTTTTKDGRIYPKVNSTIEVTKIGDKYIQWIPDKARKGLYEKRLLLEGWRKENGEWIYKGREYEAGLVYPVSASKRMSQNVLKLKDGEPDFDKFSELNLSTVNAAQYLLQVENQGIKEKITDPSQMIEIILNEIGEIKIKNLKTGELETLSAKDTIEKFQSLLAKRDKSVFDQSYRELIQDGKPIYKYLYELIQAGISETSNDPQLQQLVKLDKDGNPEFNLNIPLFELKFQQYFFAYLSKGVLAQKRAGDALVMTSPHGHNLLKKVTPVYKKGKIIDYKWEVIQRDSEEYRNNVNNAIEGFVNLRYKGKDSEWFKLADETFKKEKQDFYIIDELRFQVPEYDLNGNMTGRFSEALMSKWDEKQTNIQDSFRYMFGTRIPSQDKQSAINIKLVDWLDTSAGNSIVVPKEYQQLSGADYDVDKIYTYKQEGYWEGNKFIQYALTNNKAQDYINWRNYFFKSNKLAKKLKEKKETSEYLELKTEYKKFVEVKKQVLKNLNLVEEEQDTLEEIQISKDFIEEVSKDKRKKEYKSINLYKEQLKELEDKLKDIESVKSYLKNKKQFNETLSDLKTQIHQLEYGFQTEVLKELQLPNTLEEFEKSDIQNQAVLNNELLSYYQAVLSSDKMIEKTGTKIVSQEESPYTEEGYDLYLEKANKGIYETGTSVDWLKDADKYYKLLQGTNFNLENKKFGIRNALTDFFYFKGTKGGKKGIGSSVNLNLTALTWLRSQNIGLNLSLNLENSNDLIYRTRTNDEIERTFDNISTAITATTDEAKEQALAKYNLRGKALDVFALMLGLGYRIDQAILFVNNPLVQKYIDDRTIAAGLDKLDIEDLDSYNYDDLKNILLGTFKEKEIVETINEKEVKRKITEDDLNVSILFDFIQLEKQVEINRNIMKFVRLKRGFSPEYSDFEQILEAGFKLGLGNIKELENVYGKNPFSLIDFGEVLKDNPKSLAQLKQFTDYIVPKTKELTEKFLLEGNEQYKKSLKFLLNNVKNRSDINKVVKQFKSWLVSNNLTNPVRLDVIKGDETLAKELQKLKENPEFQDNALVNSLITLVNKDGFDTVDIKAFSRLKTDKQESLIDGFNMLYLNKETEHIPSKIFEYFGIKDGFLYKPNSISKVLPAYKFEEMSNAVDKLMQGNLIDSDKMLDDILTDISNKSLVPFFDSDSLFENDFVVGSINIDGNIIPLNVDIEYKTNKGELKTTKVAVEYTKVVDENELSPKYIRVYNNLYKGFRISDTEYKYVLIPFYGDSKVKISTSPDKFIALQDQDLLRKLIHGFTNSEGIFKEGRWKTMSRNDKTGIYEQLISEYSGFKVEPQEIQVKQSEKNIELQNKSKEEKSEILKKQNVFTVEPIQSADEKAIVKASVANKFIGFGEGILNSSTELYRKQAGKYANIGNYNSTDVIFVSIGGKRGNEAVRKEQQDKTIKEALKAIEQGAILITDNVNYIHYNSKTKQQRPITLTVQEFEKEDGLYNSGEKRLYENLKSKGYNYSEQTIDGQVLGIWKNIIEQKEKELNEPSILNNFIQVYFNSDNENEVRPVAKNLTNSDKEFLSKVIEKPYKDISKFDWYEELWSDIGREDLFYYLKTGVNLYKKTNEVLLNSKLYKEYQKFVKDNKEFVTNFKNFPEEIQKEQLKDYNKIKDKYEWYLQQFNDTYDIRKDLLKQEGYSEKNFVNQKSVTKEEFKSEEKWNINDLFNEEDTNGCNNLN